MDQDTVARGPRLRAKLSSSLLKAVSDRYGLYVDNIKDLGGSSNLNLLVDDGRNQYVVRVYRTWTTVARLEDIQLVRRRLIDGGVPCAPLIQTRDGAAWIEVEDHLVEVEAYIEHDVKMDTWQRLEAGLPLLGRIHSILAPLVLSTDGRHALASNNIDSQDVLCGTQRGIHRIKQWHSSSVDLQFISAAEKLAESLYYAERNFVGLPRQIVHGDFWDNNVLFRAEQIVMVADFDFMGERPRIDDLALTLYYTNSTFNDDQASQTRARQLRRLMDAYDSGLDQPLTYEERAGLPLAIARAPLCFVAMIAAVDSEAGARQLAADTVQDLVWAQAIVNELERWQHAFV